MLSVRSAQLYLNTALISPSTPLKRFFNDRLALYQRRWDNSYPSHQARVCRGNRGGMLRLCGCRAPSGLHQCLSGAERATRQIMGTLYSGDTRLGLQPHVVF